MTTPLALIEVEVSTEPVRFRTITSENRCGGIRMHGHPLERARQRLSRRWRDLTAAAAF
ncbi:hypothetical protein [Rhizobium binxianense]|uniref:hypothetical protein n=1 Tax=Rhizobium binxianense TaxID=3024242 RepID=UPI00235E3B14|nr:hypothetical protein [Rhizobium sp. MJ37]MDC9832855.1 hypothetical protein [Rhizobium sp. MJ37]